MAVPNPLLEPLTLARQTGGPPGPRHGPAQHAHLRVIRRNGTVTPFDPSKIEVALTKAFLAVEGTSFAHSRRIHETVHDLTSQVVQTLTRRGDTDRALHIEDIQDQVELALMRSEHHKVARAYVLYREERARARRAAEAPETAATPRINVRHSDGSLHPLDQAWLADATYAACAGLDGVDAQQIVQEILRNLFDGITLAELEQAQVMASRTLVETEPNYSYVSARFLLQRLQREVLDCLNLSSAGLALQAEIDYAAYFNAYLKFGIAGGYLDPELARFDIERISSALQPERDNQFQFLGLQTLYDRYLLHHAGRRFELPQVFFMRVAMGLALREVDREARALEFYNLLASFDFMCSTPTLFNAGTPRAQLASCFLTTIPDDLDGIFKGIRDNALLSKYAGGLGNDWTPVRGMGAHIRGTNGESRGVIPFMKVANDTAVAVNQGGKRQGAACAYLETWHIDIEEFLDLRKNTGDERRRTHDMNTANWVPDLFMQRVIDDAEWTLFSPDDVPDLHETYGEAFAERYRSYEEQAEHGTLTLYKKVRAVELWRRMLTMLFETGHPWITFKDPCNLRSPQQHAGVVHSSNLCTEITLNTTEDEVAVCNLGSVNLAAHISAEGIDHAHLRRTIHTAIRMLDNVIDINFYTIPQTRRSNLRHRPIGLGLMGYQDALLLLRIPYASEAAVEFADQSMEALSYYAIEASANLAAERGSYPTYAGSLWSRGILPLDSLDLLETARRNALGAELELDRTVRLDWDTLREQVRNNGMRNSNVMAIAPTATISNICGVSQSIEPTFRNLYVKANMSGDFTVVNAALVRDLKAHGLWDQVMVSDLKYFDGSLGEIDRIPQEIRELYTTAFEIDSIWLIEAAARRQKWLDQAQSLNLYVAAPSGRKLDELYRLAWRRGLKTTYYLRTQGATHVEKSTLQGTDGKLNAVSVVPLQVLEPAPAFTLPLQQGSACSIDDPTCEACQ